MEKEYQLEFFRSSWLGGWTSVNGNPDVYIFQGYGGGYYLLAYYYDKESERGSFSCYKVESDEYGFYIGMGTKRFPIQSEDSPFILCIGDWGSYMKD
jgi:hypothetical protein